MILRGKCALHTSTDIDRYENAGRRRKEFLMRKLFKSSQRVVLSTVEGTAFERISPSAKLWTRVDVCDFVLHHVNFMQALILASIISTLTQHTISVYNERKRPHWHHHCVLVYQVSEKRSCAFNSSISNVPSPNACSDSVRYKKQMNCGPSFALSFLNC